MPPRGDLGCLLVDILVAASLPTSEEILSPRGELHFSTGFRRCNRASCVFLFPGGLVTTFLPSSVQRFCRLLYCSPWKNLSWWCRCYSRNSLLMLWSNFVDLQKLVVTFRLLRLSVVPCCDLGRSTSLPSFADITVGLLLNSYFIMTCVCRRYNRTSLLVILLEDLFDWSCSSDWSSCCCRFTMCCDSPLPRDCDRNSIE